MRAPETAAIEPLSATGTSGCSLGKAEWAGRRALVETAFHRYKVLIGQSLRARGLFAQKVEARIACKVIDRVTSLGMLVSRKVA
jgi:hypothetical protein